MGAVLPALLAAALLAAASPARAEDETRAVWVVRYSLTSIGSVDRVVEIADQMNLNTLLVQVRGRGDAAEGKDKGICFAPSAGRTDLFL